MEVVLPVLWLFDYISLPVVLIIYATHCFNLHIVHNSTSYDPIEQKNQ
jgi:hypothetical protein